jgi:DNA-binding NtrC family response regulator
MCHVLVIEDDFLIADHIIQLIEAAGATSIAQAGSEDEAIAEARRRPPAFIMSDVALTTGTGPAAVRAIIAEHGATPVIFVTGTPAACHPCGLSMEILEKPIDERKLMDTFLRLAPR